MKKHLYLVCILFSIKCYSQDPDSLKTQNADSSIDKTEIVTTGEVKPQHPYKIKPGIDIPAMLLFDGWSLYGMNVIYNRDAVPESEILALNRNDVNKFDRPIIDNYSTNAKKIADYLFYGSMPFPLLLLADKKIRKDGLKMGVLFLETMGATGVIYTASAMMANRFRPYAYNPNVPMDTRTRGGARNSFFAGHPTVVATSTFFMAKVYSDYHPNMKNKWILYSIAGGLTATCGLMRLQAGQHFKTDVIVGLIVGPMVGVLVPQIHKNHPVGDNKLSLLPNFENGATGFTACYKLGGRHLH